MADDARATKTGALAPPKTLQPPDVLAAQCGREGDGSQRGFNRSNARATSVWADDNVLGADGALWQKAGDAILIQSHPA